MAELNIQPGISQQWEGISGHAYTTQHAKADMYVYCDAAAPTRGNALVVPGAYRLSGHVYSKAANTVRLQVATPTSVLSIDIPTGAGVLALVPVLDKVTLITGDTVQILQVGASTDDVQASLFWTQKPQTP
jgi:hypothetical protein